MTISILLAGGGTGGHVYPLVAVAEALKELAPEIRVVFVGTERGIETRVVPSRGFELELVKVLPIRGFGATGALRGVLRAALSLPESRELLRRHRPAAVLTVGGYAAGPVSLMARLAGIPVGLLEPNAVMGLANRLMAPLVQRGYTAFAPAERHFVRGRVLRSGVPIRNGFSPAPYVLTARPRRVLVLGGSQGARTLNEEVPLALLQSSIPIEVRHQCGQKDVELVRERYARGGDTGAAIVAAEVVPFIDDMPMALAWADLVISRSGASAVSEICAVGRPSLLVPYPFAAGNHQQINAETLASVGAARWLRNDLARSERIAVEISTLLGDEGLLRRMADAAVGYGRPNAAMHVAADLLTVVGRDVPEGISARVAARMKEIG
jgi:UDP-N-acetylglucosamine--N-acetylmuramyl-(pentapeptide) pyrophosphoryl-undecaprenol N-acetylglucosamine transferase